MKRLDKFLFIEIKNWLRLAYWINQRIWRLRKIVSSDTVKTIPMWARLNIELQSDCNRDCHFCPRYGDRSGVRKDANGKHVRKSMPTSKVIDIIDQAVALGFKGSRIISYKGSIGFHRLSEPFLDKRYIELATYAKEKGLKIWENTNGDVLKKNPALCSKLDGLIDVIVIGLYDYKNEKEKKEEVRFWKNRFKKTKIVFSLAAEYPLMRQNTDIYDKKTAPPKTANYPCFGTEGLRIRYDGEVSLCCEDDQCNFKLGNVFDKSIKDIWWSEKHIKIVNSLKEPGGRKLYPLCRNCIYL